MRLIIDAVGIKDKLMADSFQYYFRGSKDKFEAQNDQTTELIVKK
jgi:hypothetical protein